MFGACGSCGAACCAGCCCASTPDVTPSDASASAATMIVFGLFIAVLSAEISGCLKTSVNGSDFKLPPRRQNVDEVTSPHSKVLTRGKMFAPAIPTPSHHGRTPGGRDGICIACHCLLLAVLMPRRFNVSAAACVERCAVSAMIPRTASARAAV